VVPPTDDTTDPPELDEQLLRAVASAPEVPVPIRRPRPGDLVDGTYEIVRITGEGGMGIVYEAKDVTLGRRVALKVHRRARSDASMKRALHEARTMARIRHPNVVGVHGVGTHERALYIAMEYISGGSLRRWLRRAPRSVGEILDVFEAAASGLASAHDVGLVHRDFKPDNVLMDDDDRPLVADFGIARGIAETSATSDRAVTEPSPAPAKLSLHAFDGTLGYAAPEQLRGMAPVDARADQFSFCAALYEALHGDLPFAVEPRETLLRRIEQGALGSADRERSRRVSRRVRAVLLRGLRANPLERFSDMDGLVAALRRARSRRRSATVIVAASGGIAALGLWAWGTSTEHDACADASGELVGVWDDDRREAVRRAVFGEADSTNVDLLEASIDRYAATWSLQWKQGCHRDVVARCLTEARARLHDLLQFFERIGSNAQTHGVETVEQLPNPLMCNATGPTVSGKGVTSDAAHAALAERVDEAWLRFVADPDEGTVRELEELASEAERAGHADLASRTLALVGTRLSNRGNAAEAEHRLRRASMLAVASGSRASMAMAWSQLATVLGARGNNREAREKIELAREASKDVEDAKVRATLAHNAGLVLVELGDREAAIVELRRAVDLYGGLVGPRHAVVGRSHAALGNVLRQTGHLDEAAATLETALEILEHSHGAEHPGTLRARAMLGATCLELGRWSCAESALTEVARALEAQLGGEHPRALEALEALVNLHMRQGELDAALEVAERVHVAVMDRRDRAYVRATGNLAVLHAARSEWRLALQYARDSRNALVETLGDGHPMRVQAETLLGTILRELGQLDASAEALEAAVELAQTSLSPRDLQGANARIELGFTELARDRRAAALLHGEAILAVLAEPPGPPHVLAEAELIVAEALGPDDARARRLARKALATFRELGPGFAVQADRVDAWQRDAGLEIETSVDP
jgi:eukaryotic-like serine/threonine-protein kinase